MTEKLIDTDSRIRQIVKDSGYDDKFADVLCNLYRYMREEELWGACHSTCSVLYVALSELGYSPKICVGEIAKRVVDGGIIADNSWIDLNGKIIDFAISMTLPAGESLSNPIVLGKDIFTGGDPAFRYGVYVFGLEPQEECIMDFPFDTYMDNFPYEKDGLWTVVGKVLDTEVNIPELRRKYKNTCRNYVRSGCRIESSSDI